MSEIAFDQSFNFLKEDDFGAFFHQGIEDSLRMICVIRHFPPLVPVFNNMPLWLMRLLGDKLAAVMMLKRFARRAAKSALSFEKQPAGSRMTILREIVKKKDNPKFGVVSQRRLEEESLSLIAASADTVGNALTMATYQILKNPSIHKRLSMELQEAIPDSRDVPGFAELEKLPYLVCFKGYNYLSCLLLIHTQTAIIKEALRKSYGLVGRLPRVVPPTGLQLWGNLIPSGVRN